MILLYLVLVLVAISYYYYRGLKNRFNYWKNRGVAQLNPNFIYGDTKKQVMQEISAAEMYSEFYFKFKKMGQKFGGVYSFANPMWVVVDPSIIKLVVVKDFQYFSAHNPKFMNTLLFNNLFHMDGEPWKDMRRKLTPTFTSGKMKMMFDILLQKTIGLADLVGEMAKTGETAEMKQLLARYTTDVIGTVGFGIECDSLKVKDSEFYINGQNIFKKLIPKKSPSLLGLFLLATRIRKHRRFDLSDEENFIRNIVNETVKYREENNIYRKDFLQLLIELKNNDGSNGLSMEDIAGQCLLFISAGFETTSTTMSFALLELTQNQDIQEKLRQEVREVLEKHDGKLTYDALQEMTYLDNIIRETLRKYPPVANLPRLCTKNYNIPGTEVVIEKGTYIHIPLFALQMDPDYFPDPEKFIPERFNPENKGKIAEYTYMPFGEGPRQCLGLRFGIMQAKAGLATLVNRFNFTLNKKTPYPPKFEPGNPIFAVNGGIWLDAKVVE